jgi:hypothetical protein
MVSKGSGDSAGPLGNTESPVPRRDSEHPQANLAQSPGAPWDVSGATGRHVGALSDTPGRPAIVRRGAHRGVCAPIFTRGHLITLLVLFLDVTPALSKTLMALGKPTLYELELERYEGATARENEIWTEAELEAQKEESTDRNRRGGAEARIVEEAQETRLREGRGRGRDGAPSPGRVGALRPPARSGADQARVLSSATRGVESRTCLGSDASGARRSTSRQGSLAVSADQPSTFTVTRVGHVWFLIRGGY